MVAVTPELLASAEHTIWHDTDQVVGDGLKTAIAPNVFGHWGDPADERVRFGKILGLSGGAYAIMPVLPDLLTSAIEATENDVAETTYLEEIPAGTNVAEIWQRFFSTQLNTLGHFAVACLELANVKPIGDRNRHARGLLYVASVVDPRAPVATMAPTPYDGFDALLYTGLAQKDDHWLRRQLADNLKEAAKAIRRGTTPQTDLDQLREAINERLRVPALH